MVLSELRKRQRNTGVVNCIAERRTADLYLSVVSIGQIERGVELLRTKNPALAAALTIWLDKHLSLYSDRILAVDLSP